MIATALLAHEGRAAAHHLVEHRPQGVEVGLRRHVPTHRLLRRHVVHRSHHHPRLRETGAVESNCQTEVADHGPAVLGQPDIPGLEIAVNDALRVT